MNKNYCLFLWQPLILIWDNHIRIRRCLWCQSTLKKIFMVMRTSCTFLLHFFDFCVFSIVGLEVNVTMCAVCVHILIFSIFCSTRIGITIRCVKYFAFRRIASKLMKLWYKTWDHWSFFVDFSIKIFTQKMSALLPRGKFSKKVLNPLGGTNFDISNFRLCAFCVHIMFFETLLFLH